MEKARRKPEIILLVGISLTILAAPARGDDSFGVQLGRGEISLSFGSSNWAVYGSSWSDPGWRIDQHGSLRLRRVGVGGRTRPVLAAVGRARVEALHLRPVGLDPAGLDLGGLRTLGLFPSPLWELGAEHLRLGVDSRIPIPTGERDLGRGRRFRRLGTPVRPRGGATPEGAGNAATRGYASGYDDGYSASSRHDAEHATYTQWRHFGADDLSRHAVPYKAARDGGWSPTAIRPGAAAPDRDDLNRRGIVTPQMEIESRMVRIGDRQVELARPMGAQPVIRRNAEPTLQRALAENAQRTAVARERAARTAPTERGRGADTTAAPPQSAPHRPETTRRRDPSPDRPEPARSAQPKAGSRQPSSAGGPRQNRLGSIRPGF